MKIKDLLDEINGVKDAIDKDVVLEELKECTIEYFGLEEYRDKITTTFLDGGNYIEFCCVITNGLTILDKDYISKPISSLTYSKENRKLGNITYYYDK